MIIDYSDLIGIPFVNRGRNPKTGLDCYGLVREVYRRFGLSLPEPAEWVIDWSDTRRISAIIQHEAGRSAWKKIPPDRLIAPCVMAIRFNVPKGVVNHTGVYIGNGKFIHTRAKVGVCVDRINSPAWARQIEGYYQWVGDTNER